MHLVDQYPNTIPLFAKDSRTLHTSFTCTTDSILYTLLCCVVFDIYNTRSKKDKPYFRKTHQALFG
jgi:hypothetical protein